MFVAFTKMNRDKVLVNVNHIIEIQKCVNQEYVKIVTIRDSFTVDGNFDDVVNDIESAV